MGISSEALRDILRKNLKKAAYRIQCAVGDAGGTQQEQPEQPGQDE